MPKVRRSADPALVEEVRSDGAVTDDLRPLVTAAVHAEYGPAAIQTVDRAQSPLSSSYPTEVVTVGLVGGRHFRLFLKDLSTRRYDRDLAERRSREIAVYRDLLADADLGTARYYGSIEDPGRNRFWLLIEYVEGTQVRHEPFEVWVQAAAWLGRMQAQVAARPESLRRCGLVKPLTEDFFLATAAAAEQAAGAYAPELAKRVARALEGYPELAAYVAAQPRTLVHGCYRPHNILLRADIEPRICPVDWEAAAVGPAQYDLAYLSDGFDDRRRRLLVAAYRRAAADHGLRIPEDDAADVLLDGCDLHKNLKTLAKAVDREFPLGGVEKLVEMVVHAAARALRRRDEPAAGSRRVP